MRHLAHAARRDAGNSCCCGLQGAHLPHEAMLVYVGMCHAKYGGWNVRVRAAQVYVVYSRCAASTPGRALVVECRELTADHARRQLSPADDACGGRSTALCMGATIAIITHSVHYGSYRRSLEYRLDRKRVE